MAKAWEGTRKLDLNNPSYSKNTPYEDWMKEIPEFDELKDYLREEKGGKIASGGAQVIIRCPWCGDSKDPRSAHLYIGPNKKRGRVISYYCFLCGRGGTINPQFFRDINCYDVGLIDRVLNYNHETAIKYGSGKKIDYEYKKPNINNSNEENIEFNYNFEQSFKKLAYINNRLGLNLSFEDLDQLKIILNLEHYIRSNHIRGISRKKNVLDELTNKHIGFLSVDNTYVVMRSIVDPSELDPSIQTRYTNYQLYPNRHIAHTFYVIPCQIDINREVHVHIAEGCFDILGIYFHGDKSKRTGNELFAACSGRTFYLDVLKYLAVIPNIPTCACTVDLYLDKEKDGSVKMDKKMKEIIDTIEELALEISIHVNDYPGEKDFGVTPDRIIDSIIYHKDHHPKLEKHLYFLNTRTTYDPPEYDEFYMIEDTEPRPLSECIILDEELRKRVEQEKHQQQTNDIK